MPYYSDLEYNIPALLPRPMIMDEVLFQGEEEWHMLAVGFDSVNLSPNAQTLTRRYVNEHSDSIFTTGYGVAIDFTMDEMNKPVIQKLFNIARRRKIGKETVIRHRRTYLHLPFEHESTGAIVSDQHPAFEQWVNVVIASEAPRDNMLSGSGQLTYVAGFVWGGYDPITRTFTREVDMPLGVVPEPAAFMFSAPDNFENMTVAQLQSYAAQKEIDLEDATKKVDIISVLRSKPAW